MLITKDEIMKLMNEKLTIKEIEFYKIYINYMLENNFIELQYYLNNKPIFFSSIINNK